MLNPRSLFSSDDELAALLRPPAPKPAGVPHLPVLIIGIDAVPYTLVRRLAEDGLFADMKGPVAVNSTFPSISYTAWSNLLGPLGCGKPPGYETRYFDRARGRLTGGLSLSEVSAAWKDTFDWKLHGLVRTAFAYGFPRRYSLWELRHGLEAFERSAAPVFSMYIVSTDGLAHLSGPDALADVLIAVQTQLADFRQCHRHKPFYTVLLSDHGIAGGEPLRNIWPAVRRAVIKAGFRPRNRLGAGDRDVVFNPYGLLTGFVIYTHPAQAAAVAATVAEVPGVDLAAVRKGADCWQLLSARGGAEIMRRGGIDGGLWRYRQLGGDPLGYASLQPATSEWAPDKYWFDASRGSFYADALHRVAQSFELAAAPASVVCSCTPGCMFGGIKTELLSRATVGRLKWTHGALHRDASLGFMMSDLPAWEAPPMVRAEEALECLAAAKAAKQESA